MIGDTTSPEFAKHMMHKLAENHTPCTVKFTGVPKLYMSMVISVDDKAGEMNLDELTPNDGHEKILTGDWVRVTTTDNGVAVIFKVRAISSGTEDGLAFYTCKIPKQVDYVQRREAFRVTLNPLHKIPVTFRLDKNIVKANYLFDISFTGICFVAEGLDLTKRLRVGDLIDAFQLDMNNDGMPPEKDAPPKKPDPNLILECKVMVKRVIYDENTGNTKISAEFKELDRLQQRDLGKYVCLLERNQIKYIKKDPE